MVQRTAAEHVLVSRDAEALRSGALRSHLVIASQIAPQRSAAQSLRVAANQNTLRCAKPPRRG